MIVRSAIITGVTGLSLLFTSCKQSDSSVIDSSINQPSPAIGAYSVLPAAIDTDTLPPASKLPGDTVTLSLAAFVTLAAGTPPAGIAAFAAVLDEKGDTLAVAQYRNDGVPPDAIAGDSIFSAAINVKIVRRNVGTYRIATIVVNAAHDTNGGDIGLAVTNSGNRPPAVDSLVAPDTLSVPADSSVNTYVLSVHASDPDGLSDIHAVNADIYANGVPFPAPLQMRDDGDRAVDGDSVAGDGVFSTMLAIDSTYQRSRAISAYIYAIDNSGATSDTLKKAMWAR